MYIENPDLLKSEGALNHMVPNEHGVCLCMNEVFSWLNMSQEDLFLEKSVMLVHAAVKNTIQATHDHVVQEKLAG